MSETVMERNKTCKGRVKEYKQEYYQSRKDIILENYHKKVAIAKQIKEQLTAEINQ